MSTRNLYRLLIAGVAASAWALVVPPAQAVPSYARQTGFACTVCHTIYPELTPFGRLFKLNGYTLTGLKQIETAGGQGLKINAIPPLSAMLQVALTNTSKGQPGAQNNTVEFPETLSFYFAGEISPHMGSFMQVAYDHAEDHFTLDMTDIRYANHATVGGKDLIYGVSLNNGPSLEDVWNDTPGWRFPSTGPDAAPAPTAMPLVDMLSMAMNTAGLVGYGYWDYHWYGAAGVYRSSPQGVSQPIPVAGSIRGVAPYWRLAWTGTAGGGDLEVGAFGLRAEYPGGMMGTGPSGLADTYTDYAFGGQYQRPVGANLLSLHAVYTHERQDLAASSAMMMSNPSNTLKALRLDGTYEFGHRYALAAGYFNTWGTQDTLLYAPARVTGSRTGSPDSAGWILEADYLPWQNTKFLLQYTAYSKFNGASSNYDGFGRNASDNNTLFLDLWLMW